MLLDGPRVDIDNYVRVTLLFLSKSNAVIASTVPFTGWCFICYHVLFYMMQLDKVAQGNH